LPFRLAIISYVDSPGRSLKLTQAFRKVSAHFRPSEVALTDTIDMARSFTEPVFCPGVPLGAPCCFGPQS